MAKITRIKASDGPRRETPEDSGDSGEKAVVRERVSVKSEKERRKEQKKAEKAIDEKKPEKKDGKKPFILFRPFIALGHYLRDSWRELRQVRWPNRKTTWKMLIAVILYAALFMVLITLLDMFFSFLFNLMFNK